MRSHDFFAFFAMSKISMELIPPEITPPKPRILINDADLIMFIGMNKNIVGRIVSSQALNLDIL